MELDVVRYTPVGRLYCIHTPNHKQSLDSDSLRLVESIASGHESEQEIDAFLFAFIWVRPIATACLPPC